MNCRIRLSIKQRRLLDSKRTSTLKVIARMARRGLEPDRPAWLALSRLRSDEYATRVHMDNDCSLHRGLFIGGGQNSLGYLK